LAGTSSEDLKDGATIETIKNSEMMDQIGGITADIKKMTENGDSLLLKKLSGTVESATGAINSVDATINNINSVVDAKTKNQLQSSIAGVQRSVNDFNILSAELAAQKARIAAIMNSLDAFTKNLNSNNAAINGTMANINKTTELLSKADIGGTVNNLKRTTDQLAQADLSGTINNLKKTIDELNVTLGKVNSTEGTAGMLINDKKLYNDLQGSLHSLDALLGDLKTNPSRYLSFSVFGKKQKNVAPASNGQ
jgi:phospholipid/cholesterol/gamma-HCH transport system substrate-binding protein